MVLGFRLSAVARVEDRLPFSGRYIYGDRIAYRPPADARLQTFSQLADLVDFIPKRYGNRLRSFVATRTTCPSGSSGVS
jgi:hypothetical protein